MFTLILATTTDDLPTVEVTNYADPVELVRYVRDLCEPDSDDWSWLPHMFRGQFVEIAQDGLPVAVVVRS